MINTGSDITSSTSKKSEPDDLLSAGIIQRLLNTKAVGAFQPSSPLTIR